MTEVYYTDQFGYEALPETIEGLHFLLGNEAVSFIEPGIELTTFFNAIYAQFGDAVLKAITDEHVLPQALDGRHLSEDTYGRPDRYFYNSAGQFITFESGSPNIFGDPLPPTEYIYYPSSYPSIPKRQANSDFNGDGQDDIILAHPTQGWSGIWTMQGTTPVGWTGLPDASGALPV